MRRAGRRSAKVHLADDSIVRSRADAARAAGAGAGRAERRGARRAISRAALPGERCPAGCAPRCWSAGSRTAPRSSSTSPASARRRPGARFGFAPALSVTLWLVLAVYELESRFVAAARRAPRARGARRAGRRARLDRSRASCIRRRRRRGRRCTGCSASRRTACSASPCCMPLLLNRAERQLRRRAAARRPGAHGVPLLRLERLTFRFVARRLRRPVGRDRARRLVREPWRWDHKTVFSILGWLVFAALLAGRRAFGWRGPQRDALALRRRRAAAARLRRLALRPRGRAAPRRLRMT